MQDYDWEMELSDENKTVIYATFPKLLQMGNFDLKSLEKLQKSNCNTIGVDTLNKMGRSRTIGE